MPFLPFFGIQSAPFSKRTALAPISTCNLQSTETLFGVNLLNYRKSRVSLVITVNEDRISILVPFDFPVRIFMKYVLPTLKSESVSL